MSQIGGANVNSTQRARPTTTMPTKDITKKAVPSPASANEKSRPQTSQAGRSVSSPEQAPFPQRGQRPASR